MKTLSLTRFQNRTQNKDSFKKYVTQNFWTLTYCNSMIHSRKSQRVLSAGFLIQASWYQNHWVAPRSTKPFINLRSIKWVPKPPRDLVVKSKLSPCSGSVAFRQWNLVHKGAIKTFFIYKYKLVWHKLMILGTWLRRATNKDHMCCQCYRTFPRFQWNPIKRYEPGPKRFILSCSLIFRDMYLLPKSQPEFR